MWLVDISKIGYAKRWAYHNWEPFGTNFERQDLQGVCDKDRGVCDIEKEKEHKDKRNRGLGGGNISHILVERSRDSPRREGCFM